MPLSEDKIPSIDLGVLRRPLQEIDSDRRICLPTGCAADNPAREAPIRYARYLTEWAQSFADEP